jgi:hypothetical protein
MSAGRRTTRLAGTLLCAVALSACVVSVRSDRAAIGGGPEQATAQAQVVFRSTAVALATANAGSGAGAQPCDCESSGK